jgi:propionate CoA-transferase
MIGMTLKTLQNKLAAVDEALSFVKDSSSIAVSGFNMAATPEHLILNLFERYQKTGHPRNLFMICESLPAISGRALDLVSEKLVKEKNEDFLQGLLIPFLGFSPWTQKSSRSKFV